MTATWSLPHAASAARIRRRLEAGRHDPAQFRAAVLAVPPALRDRWLDRVLGIDDVPPDGPALPRHCAPYLPSGVAVLLRMIDRARVGPADTFVDIGSGLGRAAAFVHCFTGAGAIGIEIQPELVAAARALAARLGLARVPTIAGDAADLAGRIMTGSVFFLYCPFSGGRLATVLADLEPIAHTRALRVCSVDLPLPPRAWLAPDGARDPDLAVYRSTLHAAALRRAS